MKLCDLSVTRPVAATVGTLLLLVFGVVCGLRLAVREYPDIDMPLISIRTDYTGASANIVEEKITQRIENAVSGIQGLKSMESSSSDGRSQVTLEFDISRDIDVAANDVRDQLGKIAKNLPDEAAAPMVAKFDSSGHAVMVIAVTYPKMTPMQLTDYIDRFLLDRFSVVPGVAQVRMFRAQHQAMRVWLDRRAMAARGVTVDDIENALRQENVEYPGGRLESLHREFTVRVKRNFSTADNFRRLVVKRGDQGGFIRLGDVARVDVEPKAQREAFWADGTPTIGIAAFKQSTANTLSVTDGVKAMMAKIQKDLPPGMELKTIDDGSLFIRAALKEVEESLVISSVLVLLIIFMFLGSARASLIPAVTVPISLISSLIVLYVLGYSINLLTLLALVLAIGLVVDDSIVMLENIHRRVEGGEPPLLAAFRGARQVVFAIIATTLVLAAVFLPICLMEGKTGKLFTEFSVAITAAVVFSSLVALTLSPMMCSRLLKPRESDSWLSRLIDGAMNWSERWYDRMLRLVASYRIVSVFVFAAICILLVWYWEGLPKEYEPQEDRGVVQIGASAPEGTGFASIVAYADEMGKLVYPYIDNGEARHILIRVPNWGSRDAVNSSGVTINLQPWNKRKRTSRQIMDELRPKLASLEGLKAHAFLPGGLGGSGGKPVQFVLGGPDFPTLCKWRDIIMKKAAEYPGLSDLDYDYQETSPQLSVEIDSERAAEIGVSAAAIGRTLETMLGSRDVTTFTDRGKEYDVVLQADKDSRATPSDLSNIYVRSNRTNELIPLDNLVRIRERGESGSLKRFNRVRSITIDANIPDGYSLEQALSFLESAVRQELPETAQIGYKGLSRELKDSSNTIWFVFILALVVSYLVLAAQFESFVSPLVVMLTVPLGLIGACMALRYGGYSLNVYSQIGLIMLIGLAAKNGILIVEFANQLRDEGMPFEKALFEASRLRLRPILMTGISTVIGAVPLLLASGAGAASRQCLGTVIVYGGLSSCLLTMIVVPIGYLILCGRGSSPKELERRIAALEAETPAEI